MGEIYKGYTITTGWNDETTGFDFFVYDAEGTEAFRNKGAYFYEENALAAAREAVDGKLGPGEEAGMDTADKTERESRLKGNLAEWMMAHGTVKSDRERSNEYAGVRIAEVCWRGQDYCITWVDGAACRIEKG